MCTCAPTPPTPSSKCCVCCKSKKKVGKEYVYEDCAAAGPQTTPGKVCPAERPVQRGYCKRCPIETESCAVDYNTNKPVCVPVGPALLLNGRVSGLLSRHRARGN